MKREIIAMGIVLIVVGVIFVPVSRLPEEHASFQSVTDSCGQYFLSHIEQYLEGNNKYRIRWSGTLTEYEPQNTTLEVKNPNGTIIYSSNSSPPPDTIDFWGDLSGVYTVDFNVLKSEDTFYNIYKYVGAMETTYPYHILLPVGVLLVVLGAVVTVVGTVMPSKKLET